MKKLTKFVFPLFLSLLLSSCSITNIGKNKIHYTFDGENFLTHYYEKGKNPRVEVKEKKYHKFNGYFTEPNGEGQIIINEKGYIVENANITNGMEIYAYYVPFTFTVNFNLSPYNHEFNETKFELSYGSPMPELHNVIGNTYYELSGFAIKNDEIKISDGTTYKPGYETLNELAYDLSQNGKTIELIPTFKKEQIEMSFTYPKDGTNLITETLLVDIDENIHKVAPKYVDENGFKHTFQWYGENGSMISPIDKSVKGMAVNATKKLVNYYYTDLGNYSCKEEYSIDKLDESSIIVNIGMVNDNLVKSNYETCINIRPYTKKFNFIYLLDYHYYARNISFIVDKRQTDLEINFSSTKGKFLSFTSFENIPFIDASNMDENSLLTITTDTDLSLIGKDGAGGINGKSKYSILTGDDSDYLSPVPHGENGKDGTAAIHSSNIKLVVPENKSLNIQGGNGGNGGNGDKGANSDRDGYANAIAGGNGGRGGNGASAIIGGKNIIFDIKGSLNIIGGFGGNGGQGGHGGEGVGGLVRKNDSGGNGGNGGQGGNGGHPLSYLDNYKLYWQSINMENITLIAGNAGNGGNGGNGGYAKYDVIKDEGWSGDGGNAGEGGQPGIIFLTDNPLPNNVNLISSNRSYPGTPGSGGDNSLKGGKGYPGDEASYWTGGICVGDLHIIYKQ